jgi:outer membrane protein OmpA-like peptidoglycan-associated protein
MLGWIAILGERERIEADLSSRTATVLERSGYGWASVSFEGRDAVLSGRAVDESEPAKAVAAALDTMGVRTVDNRASLIDKVERYEWSAIRRENRIRVDGLVPSDRARRDLIGMVKANFPSLEVDDRMKLARGAPLLDVWLGGVSFGLKQLALLRDGRVDLENTNLSVSGDAIDARSYRAVKSALSGQMPQGIRLKNEAVRPPLVSPYTWSARREGKEILLVGHVPTDTVRDELMRTVRRVAPEAKMVDRMEPASGSPEGFAAAAVALIEQLGRLEEGTGQIRDKMATLTGTADTSVRAEEVKAAIGRGALASYRATGDIRHREPLIKTISPYETAVQAEGEAVVLTGYVPDEKARGVLLATAQQRFAGRRVRDELQLGAGQPPGWEQCVEAGLEALQRLGNGRAAITGRRLLVSGNTDAEPLAQSLPADVRGRAGSSCDTDVRVTLDLTAIQAKEETRRRTEQEDAQRKSDLDRTRQETQARADAERRQAEEAQRAKAEADRRQADQGASQRAEEERRRAEQAARLKAEEDRRRTEADKARTPAEQKARQQVVDACQAAMSKVAHEGVINFKRASYDLDPTSFATLNLLAEAANRCSTVVVEIEGHTDAEGTVERNQLLSDRRANSVRDYLVRAGVDPRRLVAIGYGQQKNIAPNTTAEGRAKNRRIEFVVKMP